jgi:fructokinase
MSQTFGAVEAGGTKFRVGRFSDGELLEEHRIPTEDPSITLPAVRAHLAAWSPVAVGIAAFGPITLDGADRGVMGSTPKPGWPGANLIEDLDVGVPVAIDTDVGAAAIAELDRGAGRDVASLCYVTVGTGLGGAFADRTGSHHGHGHSEVGHVPVQRTPVDAFEGICPYHGDCMEGMASGRALTERKARGQQDAAAHVAGYLGQLVAVLTYTFAPERIAFGGGAVQEPGLVAMIREQSMLALAGYSSNPAVTDADGYVSVAQLGQDAGLVGAALLAERMASYQPG